MGAEKYRTLCREQRGDIRLKKVAGGLPSCEDREPIGTGTGTGIYPLQ
jgi:hypothetical protein